MKRPKKATDRKKKNPLKKEDDGSMLNPYIEEETSGRKVDFGGQDEGYVLTYKMTLDNKSDEDLYYSGGASLLSDDGVDYIIPRKHLVDRDEWIKDDSTENASQFLKEKASQG